MEIFDHKQPSEHTAIVWLTSQMDRLLSEGSSARCRFFFDHQAFILLSVMPWLFIAITPYILLSVMPWLFIAITPYILLSVMPWLFIAISPYDARTYQIDKTSFRR